MCVAMYDILTALELALPEEIQKHVHSTQCQFSNVQKRGLFHVIAQASFRQSREVFVS